MGDLQLSELREEVRTHLGDRATLTDSRIDRWVNLSQMRIARHHDYAELRQILTTTLPYTGVPITDKTLDLNNFLNVSDASEAVREIHSFRVITGDGRSRKLKQMTPRAFDKEFPEPDWIAQDVPSIFIRWKNQLELYKVPDSNYTCELRWSKWPTWVTQPGEFLELTHKDDLVIMLAVSAIFNSLGQTERANRFFGIFNDMRKDAVNEDLVEKDTEIKPKVDKVSIGQYWTDPFVKGVPRV